ncbi:MAG: hypothetical protein H6923_05940 [Alphaproteobacteria bacterium]|nr:hypothetical protein [Alphaproteobacteria bacterium]
MSLLSGWYASRRAPSTQSASLLAAAAGAASKEVVKPPWDKGEDAAAADARVREILGGRDIFSLAGTSFGGDDVPTDQKTLFSLYRGINALQSLAAHAAAKTTSDLSLAGLDRRFSEALAKLQEILVKSKTEAYTLVEGQIVKKAEGNIAIARPRSEYLTGVIHRGAFDAALTELTGNEVFTVAVTKGSTVTNVTMDLSAISGTLNLDALVTYMNQQFANAGIVTRVARERIVPPPKEGDDGTAPLPDTWGLRIKGVSTEVLSFSAAASSPALYLVGTSGKADTQSSAIIKLDQLDTGTPNQAASARIDASEAAASATAAARDSQGNVYVVGNATGGLNAEPVKGAQDVFLTKYDSTGHLVWTRLLGAADSAQGFGVAVDGSDNVIVAGSVSGELSSTAVGGGLDGFVTKFSSAGAEIFTRQTSPFLDDEALSVTADATGAIYVGGTTKGGIASGFSSAGGRDATVTKLNADGSLAYHRQFGTTGDDRANAVALASDGGLLVASVENGHGILRKYDSADGVSSALWSIDLGDLQNGTISGIAVDGSNVYVAGSTANASLDAGGAASINGTFAGAQDGFLTRVDDAGSSASAAYTTYIGTGATDRIRGVAAAGGKVYVAGDTQGDLGAAKVGTVNGFAAQLDQTGSVDWIHQYGGREGYAAATGIAVDPQGSSVLDTLGLPKGKLDYTQARDLVAQTAVRPGDSFYIAVDGGHQRKITIDADETFRSLSFKINSVLLLDGKAEVRRTKDGDVLRIAGKEGVRIDLIAGPGERDALKGLGLSSGTILDTGLPLPAADEESEDPTDDAETAKTFGLGIPDDLSLGDKKSAGRAAQILLDALTVIRKVYREITKDPALEALLQKRNGAKGPVPQHIRAQLANYQAGLARLESGPDPGLGLF